MQIQRAYRAALCLVLLFSLQASLVAHANIGEMYGFGSRSAAMSGMSTALGLDAYSAYQNPAALGLMDKDRVLLSLGALYMRPKFTGISGVTTSNLFTAQSTTTGNIDLNYRNTLGNTIGLALQLFPNVYHLTFGLNVFGPLESTAYMDTGETYVPDYVLHRSRTQRPQIDLGLGARLTDQFSLGIGAHIGFTLTSNATLYLHTATGKSSTMRFSSSLKPKGAPYFGLLFQNTLKNPLFRAGLVARMPVKSSNVMNLSTDAAAFGGLASLPFKFEAASALFYDPATLELGGSFNYLPIAHVFAQAEFQRWNAFEAPALIIQNVTSSVNFQSTVPPQMPLKNIWVFRAGHELTLGSSTLRVGYTYHPSIFASLPTGSGNYLDPPRNQFSLGAGFEFDRFFAVEIPCSLDLHASYIQLTKQTIVKTAGNEAGTASDSKIGAPGYDAGGNILGGGLTLTLKL